MGLHSRKFNIFLLCFVLGTIVRVSLIPAQEMNQDPFHVFSSGQKLTLPVIRLEDGNYVLLDEVQRVIGGRLEWGKSGFSVRYRFEGGIIQFEDRIPFFSYDRRPYQMINPPRLWKNRFLVPLQFVTEYIPYFYADLFSYDPYTSTLEDRRYYNSIHGVTRSAEEKKTELFLHFASPPRFETDTSRPGTFLLNIFETRNNPILADSLRMFGYVDSTRVAESGGSIQILFFLKPSVRRYRTAEVVDPPGISIVFSGERFEKKRERIQKRDSDQLAGNTDREDFLIRTIFIDPGHGGRDPGAVSGSGLMEKDINLKVALMLESKLRKDKGIKVVMTRRTDTYISLKERAEMANRNRGNEGTLFVSIHCNSSKKRNVKGFEAYFLSAAKTDEDRAVAHRENLSDKLFEPAVDPAEMTDVQFILADKAQDSFIEDSSEYAEIMSRKFDNGSRIISRGLRQAGFFVLNSVHMPSILLELGYLSNSDEEKLLGDNEYQEELARLIYQGIGSCVDRNHRKFGE